MYSEILKDIEFVANKEGRTINDVELVVVSKTFPVEAITPVLAQGARIFGENKVQEAMLKWPSLKDKYDGVQLHLIGPLQSNKTAEAVALFDVIHTVDRAKIADHIAKEQLKLDKRLDLFIQVNIGSEAQKSGIELDELDSFYNYCVNDKKLNIIGLMCIPPAGKDSGPYFALLKKRAEKLGLKHLSMGMSSDFKVAIRMGATHIRVGSAIFGSRDNHKSNHEPVTNQIKSESQISEN